MGSRWRGWRVRGTAIVAAALACWSAAAPADGSVNLYFVRQGPLAVLAQQQGVKVYDGGYGSAVVADPKEPEHFYLLTDRGPNIDTSVPDQKAFFAPEYAPRIGRFKVTPHGMRIVSYIELRAFNGRKLSGLPLPPGLGNTGEVPVDGRGQPLKHDPEGVDSEGLVALGDGTFWISDEYGPFLLHVDETGRTLERIGPTTGTVRAMPRVFALRRPNRGMEGLTVLPGGTVLVGIMQSPLDNPSRAVRRASRVTRILAYDTRNSTSRQFLYVQEEAGLLNSEITAISDTRWLVVERDGNFPGATEAPARVKRIYVIDISRATDVSDSDNSPRGRLVNGKTLEELSPTELGAAGIIPATKELVVDLLSLQRRYPHDKPEGVTVLGDRTIVISNDDDFGITDAGGMLAPKRVPGSPLLVDRGSLYFITLERPLGK
jgi:hypothetical protein